MRCHPALDQAGPVRMAGLPTTRAGGYAERQDGELASLAAEVDRQVAFCFTHTRRLLLLACALVAGCSTQAHSIADVTRYYNKADMNAILDCLGDRDAEVRALAAGILAETSDTDATRALSGRAVPALGGLLKDPDPRVRRQSVKAVGAFRDARAIPALVEAVRGSDLEDVPGLAALALGSIGSASAVAIPAILEVFPAKPYAERTQKRQALYHSVGASARALDGILSRSSQPGVRPEDLLPHFDDTPTTGWEDRLVSVPAAAAALQDITGMDGGASRESWQNALHLPAGGQKVNESERDSPK